MIDKKVKEIIKQPQAVVYAIAEALIEKLEYEPDVCLWTLPDGAIITLDDETVSCRKRRVETSKIYNR